MENYTHEANDLRYKISGLENEISILENEKTKLLKEIDSLIVDKINLSYDNKTLKSEVALLEYELDNCKEDLELFRLVKRPTLTDVEKIEFLKNNWLSISIEDLEKL